MKKILIVSCAVLFVISFALSSVAQELTTVKGTVTKIDMPAKSLTIKTMDGTTITIVMEDPALLSRVQETNKAEVRYMVKDGVNSGVKLRKLIEGCD